MTQRALIAIGIAFALASGVALAAGAEDDRFEDPALGQSGSPDANLAGSQDSDALEAQAQDPDALLGGSGNPDAHLEGAQAPDALGHAESLDAADDGRSEAIQDLPDADVLDARVKKQDAATVPSPDTQQLEGQIQSLETARRDLAAAQERVDELDHAYADMLRNDDPRGEERQKLIDARAAAHQELELVQQRYDALLGGTGGGPAKGGW